MKPNIIWDWVLNVEVGTWPIKRTQPYIHLFGLVHELYAMKFLVSQSTRQKCFFFFFFLFLHIWEYYQVIFLLFSDLSIIFSIYLHFQFNSNSIIFITSIKKIIYLIYFLYLFLYYFIYLYFIQSILLILYFLCLAIL